MTVRIVLNGRFPVVSAVSSLLIENHDFSLVRIPVIGDCVRAGKDPKVWHHSFAQFLAAHPGRVVCHGGLGADLQWLTRAGALLWDVSDRGTIEVHAAYGTDFNQTFTMPSVRALNFSVQALLQTTEDLSSSPEWRRIRRGEFATT